MDITVVSRADFESYGPSRATAVLRIYEPIDDYADDARQLAQSGWGDAVALSFWDVGVNGMRLAETLVARLLGRWRRPCLALGRRVSSLGDDIPWRPFVAADARDIARFADGLADKGIRHVLVVCGNGRSRSYTIARWLSQRLGAGLTASRGWERESPAIAAVLRRVSSPARPTAVAAARMTPAG